MPTAISFREFQNRLKAILSFKGEATVLQKKELGQILKCLGDNAEQRDTLQNAVKCAKIRTQITDTSVRSLIDGRVHENISWAFYYYLHRYRIEEEHLRVFDLQYLRRPAAAFFEQCIDGSPYEGDTAKRSFAEICVPDRTDITPRLKLDVVDSQNHFSKQTLNILGREEEQNLLREFRDQKDADFSWLQIAGAGGQGKSRLAFDLALESKTQLQWHAGFIEPEHLQRFTDQIENWNPKKDTLIVIDYVIGNIENIGKIIRFFSGDKEFKRRIRLLLLERQRWDRGGLIDNCEGKQQNLDDYEIEFVPSRGVASWFLQMCTRADGLDPELHNTRFTCDRAPRGVIELSRMPPDRLYEIVEKLWEKENGNKSLPLSKNKITSELKRIDKEGRPLYAHLFIQSLIAGEFKEGSSLEQLLQAALERERDSRWKKEVCTPPPKFIENTIPNKIALVATITGSSANLGQICPRNWGPLTPDNFELARIITDTSRGTNDSVPNAVLALKPDILGEWFVLFSLRGGLFDVDEIVKTAWRLNPDSTSGFLLRCVQDFANHPSGIVDQILSIDIPDEHAKKAFHSIVSDIFVSLYQSKAKQYPENVVLELENACISGDARAQSVFGLCMVKGDGIERSTEDGVKLLKQAARAGDGQALANLGVCYVKGIGTEENLKKAFECFEKAAEAGYKRALGQLGRCYQEGLGVEKNAEVALKYYRQSAKNDDAQAIFRLGEAYLNGTGIGKNYRKAIVYFQRAEEIGHSGAINALGWCYQNGIGVKVDLIKSIRFYQRAIDANDTQAMINLSYCYHNGLGVEKNHEKAAALILTAADADDTRAMLLAGHNYKDGNGVEVNFEKAFSYYRQAAEAGDIRAKIHLGSFYERGLGVEKNQQIAAEMYSDASQSGNTIALFNIGRCYYYGIGVQIDYLKAVQFLNESAEKGHALAMVLLGRSYMNGLGVNKDPEKSVQLFKDSINLGDNSALGDIGYCYFVGLGLELNLSKSVEYLEKASLAGDFRFVRYLAKAYAKGLGTQKKPTKAYALYRKAADLGDAVAIGCLGVCLYTGFGVDKDLTESVKLFERAADLGDVVSRYNLGVCYQFGTGVGRNFACAISHYQKAADAGHSQAMMRLARLYYEGNHIHRDIQKAIELIRAAADGGCADAKEILEKNSTTLPRVSRCRMVLSKASTEN